MIERDLREKQNAYNDTYSSGYNRGYSDGARDTNLNNKAIYKKIKKEAYAKGYADAKVEFAPKWTRVEDGLPEEKEWVLCRCQAGIYEVLRHIQVGWFHDVNHFYMDGFVIAWMPIPKYEGVNK